MDKDHEDRRGERWAELRFAIIGPLLACPSERGALHKELERLAEKSWKHPKTGQMVRFGVSTLERWYYQAKQSPSPIQVLGKKRRSDAGTNRALTNEQKAQLLSQYSDHPTWSYQLQRDNLAAWADEDHDRGSAPSYSSIHRFLLARGLVKKRRVRPFDRSRSEAPSSSREKRSFEVEYVGGLWHLDFHHASRHVLLPDGRFIKPILLTVLDDRSRLCCHAQWYAGETAGELVHGLTQALLKHGLPRAQMTDNGSAMIAAETREGLRRLSIIHETTLPYSPYQNAKQEVFFAQVEGRLMALLEGEPDLTLSRLNYVTCAWVEMEYHREVHREIAQTPLSRFLDGPSVLRPAPSPQALSEAFTTEVVRTLRRSDGTFTLNGVRFEVPSRFHHLRRLTLRVASWNLTSVLLCDPASGDVVTRLHPLDRHRNAGLSRRPLAASPEIPLTPSKPLPPPPLLTRLLAGFAATGLPPAFLPHPASQDDGKDGAAL